MNDIRYGWKSVIQSVIRQRYVFYRTDLIYGCDGKGLCPMGAAVGVNRESMRD